LAPSQSDNNERQCGQAGHKENNDTVHRIGPGLSFQLA
jgi:hypothetical protein